jgi:hypothetical protein
VRAVGAGWAWLVLALVLLLAAEACGASHSVQVSSVPPSVGCGTCGAKHPAQISSAAPPLVVCGTTLSTSVAGPVIYDLNGGGVRVITSASVGGFVFLRVAEGCTQGATVSIEPVGAATIVKEARAQDGEPAAIVLMPTSATATVTAQVGTGPTGRFVISVGAGS